MKRLSELDDMAVFDADGRKLGCVHEIHARDGVVTELVYGTRGWIERLTGKAEPSKVAWSRVARIDRKGITLSE